jgi:3-phosphoshikimate 1-carboxyvinyltransferase
MAAELRKLGAGVVEGDDFIEVTPPRALARRQHPHLRRPPHGDVPVAGRLQCAGRCRAAAAAAHLDPACVAKTFPDYFEALFALVAGRHRPRCR